MCRKPRSRVVACSIRVSVVGALVALGGCGGQTHGSDGTAGTAGAGGIGGATQPGANYCQLHSDCVVVEQSNICCGSCGTPAPQDVHAISQDERQRRHDRECADDTACPSGPCTPLAPRYLAACEANTCTVVDLWNHDATSCRGASDCSLRTTSCCGCDGANDSISSYVAVSRTESELPFCDSPVFCDRCLPARPGTFNVGCVDGSCRAVDCAVPEVDSGGTCDAWSH